MRSIAFFTLLSFGLATTPALALVVSRIATVDDPTTFRQIDTDVDGRVTRAEFDAGRAAAFTRADANRDGKLTRDELRLLVPSGSAAQAPRPSREQLQRLRGIDQNGDRAIDAAEFGALGHRLFTSLDANGDGIVTPDEAGALGRAMGLGG